MTRGNRVRALGRLSARRACRLSLPLLAALAAASPAQAAEPQRYEIDANIDPARGHLEASARVVVRLETGASRFSFDLHGGFRISECAVDGQPAGCTPAEPPADGSAPVRRTVTVELPAPAGSDAVSLEVRYAGRLRDLPSWGAPGAEGPFVDDAIGPERVELALYSAWYPSFGYGPTFDTDVRLTLPGGWGVACIGREREHRESAPQTTGRWVAQSVNDVVVVASPRLVSLDVATAAGRVSVHHTRLPERYLRREVREVEETLLLFTRILGPAAGGGLLQHVYSPREWGQGFARPGMIVVSEGRVLKELAADPDHSALAENSHEAAHFWWRFGRGQGDWINETFAEYLALLAVRSIHGADAFGDALEERRESVRALPPDAPALAVVPFDNSGDGYTIRYHKGALMLDAFRQHLGDDAFFDACRSFYQAIENTTAGTDDFRSHWREALKDDGLLSSWLDSRGPGPVRSGVEPDA